MNAPESRIWLAALRWLMPYSEKVSAPLLCPLQVGGLSIEWHEHGLNIEVRFRNTNHVFVLVEDARRELATFQGRDNTLARAAEALRVLAKRSN